MPNVNITPQTVLLTSSQAATFEATDGNGQPLSVSWSLNPPIGNLATPVESHLSFKTIKVGHPLACRC